MFQVYGEIRNLWVEIRRLRGKIDAVIIGNQIIPPTTIGGTVPAPIDGAIIRGNATPGWERLGVSVPSAGLRNVIGLDNGDLRPGYKALLDTTDPTDLASGVVASPGTSLFLARRDHIHGQDDVYTINMAAAL